MGRLARNRRRWPARIVGILAILYIIALEMHPLAGQAPPAAAESTATPATDSTPPLTLDACLRIAAEQQPALAARRASLAAAQEGYRGALELCLPTFIVRDLPIRRQQALLGITIAEASLNQAEWETVYAVTRTYFGIVYAQQQQRVVDDLANSLRFYQERVHDLVSKGEGPKEWSRSSEEKITIYLELAEVRRAEALRGMERANAALREAMGIAPDSPLRISAQTLPAPNVTPNRGEIIALALARRGEMVQVVTAAEVTDLEVAAQGKSIMPRVTTFAFGADIHAHPVPQGISNTEYRPGATGLEMPPSLAGPRCSRVAHARDLSARATAVVDKTRNLIALEAEDKYYKWEEASRKVSQSQTAAQSGSRLAKNTRSDFRAGLNVRIEDILTSEALAAQAGAAHNEALYELVVALADLQRVTAGGFDPGLNTLENTGAAPATPVPQ
jgi:outer membrane protein TolC